MILNSPLCDDDLGPQSTGTGDVSPWPEDDQPELEEIEDDPQDNADSKSLLKKWTFVNGKFRIRFNGGTLVPYFWAYFLGISPEI